MATEEVERMANTITLENLKWIIEWAGRDGRDSNIAERAKEALLEQRNVE